MIHIVCAGISVHELQRLDISSVAVFPILGSARLGLAGKVLRWTRRQLGWWAALRVCREAGKIVLVRPPLLAEWVIARRLAARPRRPMVHAVGAHWQERWERLGADLLRLTGRTLFVRSAVGLKAGKGRSPSRQAVEAESWPASASFVVLAPRPRGFGALRRPKRSPWIRIDPDRGGGDTLARQVKKRWDGDQ